MRGRGGNGIGVGARTGMIRGDTDTTGAPDQGAMARRRAGGGVGAGIGGGTGHARGRGRTVAATCRERLGDIVPLRPGEASWPLIFPFILLPAKFLSGR